MGCACMQNLAVADCIWQVVCGRSTQAPLQTKSPVHGISTAKSRWLLNTGSTNGRFYFSTILTNAHHSLAEPSLSCMRKLARYKCHTGLVQFAAHSANQSDCRSTLCHDFRIHVPYQLQVMWNHSYIKEWLIA